MRWPRYLAEFDLEAMFQLLPVGSSLPPVTVSGFSRYKTQLGDLPATERRRLDDLADQIAASYTVGKFPIIAALLIGHADQDLSRGHAFEEKVSIERAETVRAALRGMLQKRLATMLSAPHVDEIFTRAMGLGARNRVVANPGSEAQRAANRRVVIYVAEAMMPIPPSRSNFPVPPQKHLLERNLQRRPLLLASLVSVNFAPAATSAAVTAPGVKFPTFTEGPPTRPDIKHDHGFLDDGNGNLDLSKRQAPTAADRARKLKWIAIWDLAVGLRSDLDDALGAYQHFLIDNDGTPRTVRYERFVNDDDAGKTVLKSAIDDTRAGALDVYDAKFPMPPPANRRDTYQITGDAIGVGGRDPRYPYPTTENWQKAIGAHFLWIDAAVTVDTDPTAKTRSFTIGMTVHVEDMYNFNPGAHDIATGTADAENGRFEIVGLGHEYLNTATLKRDIIFTVPLGKLPDNRVAPPNQKVVKER